LKTFPWGHSRRINLASNNTKKEFGSRLQKVTIDAGFTCPNRDGKISEGGCSFCNNNAFNPSYCQPEKSITEQINQGLDFHKKRYRKAGNHVAYFQAYSNTYAPVEVLRERYFEALNHENIIGLVIGTRPDCIDENVLALLNEINKQYYLVLELGIESVYNETLNNINRGHSFEKSVWAINEANKLGIRTGGHIIFGLPGETRKMMLESAKVLSELPLHSLKFHQLQIVKDTRIGRQFTQEPEVFKLFGLYEYIDFIIEYLGLLSPSIVIERLAGETQPDYNLGMKWNIRYDQVLRHIEEKMEEKNEWQGKHYIHQTIKPEKG
jgi:radical SAM protein (TIGR01212 family)